MHNNKNAVSKHLINVGISGMAAAGSKIVTKKGAKPLYISNELPEMQIYFMSNTSYRFMPAFRDHEIIPCFSPEAFGIRL